MVAREIMLVKVRCTAAQRAELTNIAHIFHGGVCDVAPRTLTLEITGKEDKMAAAQRLLASYGVLWLIKSVHAALAAASGWRWRSSWPGA